MNTTKESPHGTNRKTAISVGVLYIIGTVAGFLSRFFSRTILDAPNYLIIVSSNQDQTAIAVSLMFIMGLSLAMIPVMLFPILKKIMKPWLLGMLFSGRWRLYPILRW